MCLVTALLKPIVLIVHTISVMPFLILFFSIPFSSVLLLVGRLVHICLVAALLKPIVPIIVHTIVMSVKFNEGLQGHPIDGRVDLALICGYGAAANIEYNHRIQPSDLKNETTEVK
jgi:hypothetical protein